MKSISLKLPEELLDTSGHCADALHMSRAAYLRVAIERMNRGVRWRLRTERMATVSKKVRAESMRVNAEFAAIEQAPDVSQR